TNDETGRIRFHRVAPPDEAEMARVTTRIAGRIVALLRALRLGAAGPIPTTRTHSGANSGRTLRRLRARPHRQGPHVRPACLDRWRWNRRRELRRAHRLASFSLGYLTT